MRKFSSVTATFVFCFSLVFFGTCFADRRQQPEMTILGQIGTPDNDAADALWPEAPPGTAPAPFMPGKDLVLLEKITPGNTWGGFKGGCGLRTARRDGDEQIVQSVAVVPLHVGSWRGFSLPRD